MARRNALTSVCVDSSVVTARLTGDQPEHADGIAALFHEAQTGAVRLFGSTWLLAEVYGHPSTAPRNEELEARVMAVLDNPRAITLVQTTVEVGKIARDLRRGLVKETADAVHLASAIAIKADHFMTTDYRLPIGQTVQGVLVGHPRSTTGQGVLSG